MQAPLLSNPHPLLVGRCLLRDTVVPIPEPEDLIVNYIEPSHVVVQRCTGKIERDCKQCMKMEWVSPVTPVSLKFPSLPFPPPLDNGGRCLLRRRRGDISRAALKTLAIRTSFLGGCGDLQSYPPLNGHERRKEWEGR